MIRSISMPDPPINMKMTQMKMPIPPVTIPAMAMPFPSYLPLRHTIPSTTAATPRTRLKRLKQQQIRERIPHTMDAMANLIRSIINLNLIRNRLFLFVYNLGFHLFINRRRLLCAEDRIVLSVRRNILLRLFKLRTAVAAKLKGVRILGAALTAINHIVFFAHFHSLFC